AQRGVDVSLVAQQHCLDNASASRFRAEQPVQAPLHPLAGPPDKRGKRPPATALDLSQGHAGAHRRGHLNILAEQGGGAIEAPRIFKIADMAQPRQELKMVAIVELGLSLAGSAQNRDANAAGSRSS